MAVIDGGNAETLMAGIGNFWDYTFRDSEFLKDAMAASETSVAQVYLDVMLQLLKSSMRDIPVYDRELWKFITIDASELTLNADTGYYDIACPDNFIDARFIQNRVLYPDVIYEAGYDFEVDTENKILTFYTNIAGPPVVDGLPYYLDAAGDTQIGLWAQDARVDNDALYEYIGLLFDQQKVSSETYKVFLQSIWTFYVAGPTVDRVIQALNGMAGLPISKFDNDVIAAVNVGTPAGYQIITENTEYFVDPTFTLHPNVVAGNTLNYLDPLTATFLVDDYITDPTWWDDATIPLAMAPGLSLYLRQANPHWYACVYGGPGETINAWSDDAGSDFDTDYFVVPGDILWVGPPAAEEPFTITAVDDQTIQFSPVMETDIDSGGRYSIGSLVDLTLRKPVATDGHSMRVGGLFYGHPTLEYGDYREHNLAWNLWNLFLKYHVFNVFYDEANLPDTVALGDLVDVLNAGKPAYTYAYIRSWSFFSETVNPDDSLNVAAGVPVDETVSFDDNTWVYGSDEVYDEPMVYYMMMDRDYTTGALAGPPATAPAIAEAVYSATIEASATTDFATMVGAPFTYTLSDGVITDAGHGLSFYQLQNSSAITTLEDLNSPDRIRLDHSATTTDFWDATLSAPFFGGTVTPQAGAVDLEWKFDVSDLDAVTGSELTIMLHNPTIATDWVGARVSFNGLNECIVECIDTVSDVSTSTASYNMGTGVTTMWVRLRRLRAAYDDFVVDTKKLDGDAWTNVDTRTRADIDNLTGHIVALASTAGTAVEMSVVDHNQVGWVS